MRSKAVLAYAAGLLDGEGCITIASNKSTYYKVVRFELRVHITSTTFAPLYWMQTKFGGRIENHKPYKVGWKQQGRWILTGKRAASFLNQILPYLLIKHEQAKLGLEFQSYKTGRAKRPTQNYSRQEEIYKTIKFLNK